LLLELVKKIATNSALQVQFWAALVPTLMPELDFLAARAAWQMRFVRLGMVCKLISPRDNHFHDFGMFLNIATDFKKSCFNLIAV